ncbi:hypothetical protein DY000_02002998 [Brassica cretica]|uniref:Uncharacterized protein n=1 Tax=Brassica cretica TaxID=69181 RepID=A0ABQ7CNI3_BRACR|nr:hypothetical protein DY000_02002998 [Brassica cretica]
MLFCVVFGEDSSWTVNGAIASTHHFTPLFIASSPPMWIMRLTSVVATGRA